MSISIISVGNGGFNIASDMISSGLFKDIQFIVCDTSSNDLERNSEKADEKYLLTRIRQSEVKSQSLHLVNEVVEHTGENIILCATLGGQTGSHYAPLIALNAIMKGKNVYSFVSSPAYYEGESMHKKVGNALRNMIVASNLVIRQDNGKLGNFDLWVTEMNKPLVDTLASIMSLTPSSTEFQMLLTSAQQSETAVEKQNALFNVMVECYGLDMVSGMSLDNAQKYIPGKYQEEDKVEPLIWIKPDDYGAFTPEQRGDVFDHCMPRLSKND